MSLFQLLIRAALRPASLVAPMAVGRLAMRAFCRPPARRTSERIVGLLASGQRNSVAVRDSDVAVWSWGTGPRVLLVHGWGGVGGQLATFVPALRERGCSAMAFDAPGHGASHGHESSLIHVADAITIVAQTFGPIAAIVAHSLGAAAATLAMTRGLDVQAAVFLGPPAHPSKWVETFARRYGLTTRAIDAMRSAAEQHVGFQWQDIETTRLASQMRAPLLILHDVDDDEVSVAEGRELAAAWPNARFEETRGLGHRRILSDAGVIDRSADFIASSMAIARGRSADLQPT